MEMEAGGWEKHCFVVDTHQLPPVNAPFYTLPCGLTKQFQEQDKQRSYKPQLRASVMQ